MGYGAGLRGAVEVRTKVIGPGLDYERWPDLDWVDFEGRGD